MIFSKKLIFICGSSAGILGAERIASTNIRWYDNTILSSDYENLFELTKNIKDVWLDPSIDPNISQLQDVNKFLYSLFSTNLETFSENWNKYFYNWAIYKWADWLLNHTQKGSFSGNKEEVRKILKEEVQYKPNQGGEGTPFDAAHWTRENNAITESITKKLDEVFNKFFFDEIKVETGGKIKKDQLDNYGDPDFAKAKVDFQEFVLDDWISRQNPVLLCKKTWDLDKSFSGNAYSESTEDGQSKSDSPTFEFPDFTNSKETIVNFNKSGSCENKDKKVFTLVDLDEFDGREIDGFVAKYFSEIKNEDKPKDYSDIEPGSEKSDDISDDISDVVGIFAVDDQPTGGRITQPKPEVISDSGSLKGSKNKHFVQFRKVKFGNDNNKKGTWIRTTKGITFLYWDQATKDIKQHVLKENDQPILKAQLKAHFKTFSGEILGRYFAQEEVSKSGGIFGHKGWGDAFYELSKSISQFHGELRRNKFHWRAMSKLSEAVASYDKYSFSRDNKPSFSAGLATTVWMKRNLDGTTETSANDGLFPLLKQYYDKDWKPENLFTYSTQLKKAIADYLNSIRNTVSSNSYIKPGTTTSSYYLGDYILDNIYSEFLKKDEGKFIRRATVSLFIANEIKFSYEPPSSSSETPPKPEEAITPYISALSEKMIDSSGIDIEKSASKPQIQKRLEESIKNVYFGTRYFEEKMEHRLNYGGLKYSEPSKCVRKLETTKVSSASKPAAAPSTPTCNIESNHSEWIKKLDSYWFNKNYVFGEAGYEFGSELTNDYLKFLYSLSAFSKDSFSEFRKLVDNKIPAGKFGALVWLEEVNKAEQETGSADQNTLKEISTYFKSTNIDSVLNPFFSKSINVKETTPKNLSTGHVGAFAKVGNEHWELFGFQGIHTSDSKTLPDSVKDAIFKQLNRSNPSSNKNFASQRTQTHSVGSAFGSWDEFKEADIETFVDSFKTSSTLKGFFDAHLSSVSDAVFTGAHSSPTDYNLHEIKDKIKKELKKDGLKQKLIAVMSRFSGFLQNHSKDDSKHNQKPYFIPKENDGDHGYLTYITQVSKNDMNAGINDFVSFVGIDTFLKSIVTTSLDKHINSLMVSNFLVSKGVIIS